MFAGGGTLNGLFFKVISSWQFVLLLVDLDPLLMGLAGLLFYM